MSERELRALRRNVTPPPPKASAPEENFRPRGTKPNPRRGGRREASPSPVRDRTQRAAARNQSPTRGRRRDKSPTPVRDRKRKAVTPPAREKSSNKDRRHGSGGSKGHVSNQDDLRSKIKNIKREKKAAEDEEYIQKHKPGKINDPQYDNVSEEEGIEEIDLVSEDEDIENGNKKMDVDTEKGDEQRPPPPKQAEAAVDSEELARLWKQFQSAENNWVNERDIAKNDLGKFTRKEGSVDADWMNRVLFNLKDAHVDVRNCKEEVIQCKDITYSDERIAWLENVVKDITQDFREIENTVLQLIESRRSNVNVDNPQPKESTDGAMQNPLNPTTETQSHVETLKLPSTTPNMAYVPLQAFRPLFSARKEGISFDGSSPRLYQNFCEGWKTVEAHFREWGQSNIALFRELKRALSGRAKKLIEDIPESEIAITDAFKVLNNIYKRPLLSVIDTYKKLMDAPKSTGSQQDYEEMYRRYITVGKVRNMYKISEETSNAVWMIAATLRAFTPKMEQDFLRYVMKHHIDSSSPLQYKITSDVMEEFMAFEIKSAQRVDVNQEKRSYSNNRFKGRSNVGTSDRRYASASFPRGRPVISKTFKVHDSKFCKICKKRGHESQECKNTRNMTPAELLRLAKSEHLCTACLTEFKFIKDHLQTCKGTCQKCGRRHITMLHDVLDEEFKKKEERNKRFNGGYKPRGPFGKPKVDKKKPAATGEENPQNEK